MKQPDGQPRGNAEHHHARPHRRQAGGPRYAATPSRPGHLPRRAEPTADGEQDHAHLDLEGRRKLGDKQPGNRQRSHGRHRKRRHLQHSPDRQRAATKEKRGAGVGRRQWGVRQERGIGEAERERQPRSLEPEQLAAPEIDKQGDEHAPYRRERPRQQQHAPRRAAVLEEIRPRQGHHVADGPAGMLERRQRPACQHERNGTPALRQVAVLRMQAVVVQLPIRHSADDVQGLVERGGFPRRGTDSHAPPESKRSRE